MLVNFISYKRNCFTENCQLITKKLLNSIQATRYLSHRKFKLKLVWSWFNFCIYTSGVRFAITMLKFFHIFSFVFSFFSFLLMISLFFFIFCSISIRQGKQKVTFFAIGLNLCGIINYQLSYFFVSLKKCWLH